MSLEVFPALAGLEYPVVRTPIFKTLTQEAASGMETRAALHLYPRWKYTLSFNFLRDDANDEFRTLLGFFLARRGAYEAFLFNDPDDNVVAAQPIGIGNGSNKVFQLVRTFGGFTEPVLCPVFVTIFLNGVALTGSQWAYTSFPGQVQLNNAPGNGVIVTSTLSYCWPVRFVSDQYDFSKFMNRLWEQKKLDFISVKNLTMKPLPDSLRELLGGGQFYMADCYTFILSDGLTIRYTTAEAPITDHATGHVFAAFGPFFERSKVSFRIGVQVDELNITLTARPTDIMFPGGPSWLPGLRAGVLDGAEVQLDRAFMPDFGDTSAGLVTLFYGRVVEVDVGRTQATIKANTHLELLNLQWPWRLFQPGCARTLFDAGCTLSKSSASFHDDCHVVAGSSLQVLRTDYARPNNWASLGTLTFTSGALTGQSFAIKVQGGGTFDLLVPLPSLPAAGDGLRVYAGCDKTQATCRNKFNNIEHFAGQPYVPVPEMAA